MPFKLPKLAWSAILAGWLLSFPKTISAAEDGVFSLKGQVPGLISIGVSHPVLRSDGRYLFYSNSNSWSVLDLLDMVRKGSAAVSVNGTIQAMGLQNDNRLIVVTDEGIQYFDVTEVFDPEEEDTDYELPDLSIADRVVSGACVNDRGTVFYLEVGEDAGSHRLRVIKNKTETNFVEWNSLFGDQSSDVDPLIGTSILCAKDYLLILAEYQTNKGAPEYKNDRFVSRINYDSPGSYEGIARIQDRINSFVSGLEPSREFEDYNLSEFGFDADKKSLVMGFNAINPTQANGKFNDAFVYILTISDFSNKAFKTLGQGLNATAKYKLADTSYLSFFLDEHDFSSPDLEGENELLNIKQENFNSSVTGASFGLPGDSIFPPPEISSSSQNLGIGSQFFSEWLFSSKDNYVFGNTGSSGLILLTKAPALYFETNPGIPTLSGSSPLEFGLATDENIDYEIRLIEEIDSKGDSSGIDLSKGKLVAAGRLTENTTNSFSLSASEVNATEEGELSLLIVGRPRGDDSGTRVARTGLRFNYDPPPDPVKNFKLKIGSQSVHVFFDPTSDHGDLDEYQIYFSYDESDLESLPSSDTELASYSHSISLQNGESLSSPARVSADRFNGKYVIAPIENDRELFVRVQVVDEHRQYSANNPEALAKAPKATRRLESILGGSANGCSLVKIN